MILKKLLTLIIAISISFALVAQSDDETVQSRQAEISNIGQSLEKGLLDKGKARDRLRELRDKARSEIQRLGKLKTEHEEQIKALGEPQITGVVETPEVKERREELNTALAKIAASLTQARLNADDSSRLLNLISSDTRGAFREHLFKKDNGILSSNRWSHSLDILTISSNKLNKFVSDWYTTSKTSDALKNHLVKLIAIFGLLIVVFGPLRKRINLILKQKIKAGEYNENSHYHTTLIALFTRFIGVLVTGYTILIVISSTGLITESWHEKLSIVWLALLIWMIVDSLLVAIFVPKIPAKRLIPIDDSSALRARYLCSIAVTFLIVGHTSDLLMNQSQDFSGFNQVLNVIISFSIALLILMATRSEIKIFPEEIIESTTNNIGRKKVSRFYSRIWKYLKICAVPGALLL